MVGSYFGELNYEIKKSLELVRKQSIKKIRIHMKKKREKVLAPNLVYCSPDPVLGPNSNLGLWPTFLVLN